MAAIHIIESGDAKRFGDLAKDLMQQAHLGQDFYPTSSDGAFELMVRVSGWYQALVHRQGHIIGCGGNTGGLGNGDRGKNSYNRRVVLLKQGDINRTHFPSIDVTTIDADFYY